MRDRKRNPIKWFSVFLFLLLIISWMSNLAKDKAIEILQEELCQTRYRVVFEREEKKRAVYADWYRQCGIIYSSSECVEEKVLVVWTNSNGEKEQIVPWTPSTLER